MKNTSLSAAVLGVTFGACFLPASPSGNSLPASQAGESAAQKHSEDQRKVQAFTGTIAKTTDRFVLVEDKSQTLFDLDDQSSAGKFEGRKVKVTGTLDAVNQTIHVQTIEDATA
jgi:hypothetical protein